MSQPNYAKSPTKTGYELSSNTLEMDALAAIIVANGDTVARQYINRFGCSVVRAVVKKTK